MKKLFSIFAFFLLNVSISAQPTIVVNQVLSGLTQPMQVVHAGDGSNRIFIPQKGGVIRVFDRNFISLGTFLTVSSISSGGEQGLLSMCFHPQYKTNGLFFVYYTTTIGSLEIARYQVGSGSDSVNLARPSSKRVVITIPHPTYNNHNGGTLRFGKDGFLYLSTGDGGGGGDPDANAQNKTKLLGKMLRLNVNASNIAPYYTVPASNPFGNEVFQYGLRNPFRWNFDRATGDMWIGDVGQGAFEEFNRCHRDSLAGVNYGWRCYEGNAVYDLSGCNETNYKFPFLTYPKIGPVSAVGGTVYRGETYTSLKGYYLCTDFYSGQLFKVKYDSLTNTFNTTSQTISFNNNTVNGVSDFGESEDGEIYITSLFSGNVFRIQTNDVAQYMFVGNGNWTDAVNWSDNIIPPSTSLVNTIITIKPSVGGQCVVNMPISIPKTAKIIVENSKLLRMNNNLTFQ